MRLAVPSVPRTPGRAPPTRMRLWFVQVDTARARNEGTFFKGLFKADVLQQSPWTKEGEAGGSGRGDPAADLNPGVRTGTEPVCNLC